MTQAFIPRTTLFKTDDASAEAASDRRYRLHRRFDRLGRLYGDGSVEGLMHAKVIVFGVGGVGSFAAESLARSAIGHLVLIDGDDVCVTNANRQLQALQGQIGEPKAEVLRDRLQQINPRADIRAERVFYNAQRSEALLESPWGGGYDFVVDCIDNMTAKAHLLMTCRQRGIPIVSSMGAAARRDPTQVRIADLSETTGCRMAAELRKVLRREYGFPRDGAFGIPAVYSGEPRQWPRELSYDEGKGFRCVCPNRNTENSCDAKALIDGTASFVTGTFGLVMASVVVNRIAEASAVDARPAMDRRGFRPAEAASASVVDEPVTTTLSEN